jgi:hypothetical protein
VRSFAATGGDVIIESNSSANARMADWLSLPLYHREGLIYAAAHRT